MIVDHDQLIRAMAKVLKERRTHLHLTQIDLAKLSGLHRSYIADYERGERNMSVENLNRVASVLDMTGSKVIALAERELATGSFVGLLPKKRRTRQQDKRLTLASATALILRQRRETLRLTEAKLAKRCGIPKTSIVSYESGQQKISLETMSKLVLALDIKASKVIALAERRVAIEQSKRQSK